MGLMNTGIAKTRAAASDARADLAESSSELIPAQSWLKLTSTADEALRKVGGTWFGRRSGVSSLVEAASAQTNALRTRARANVDALTAKQEAARSRLALAEKSQHAMTRLAGETDKILGD